MKIVSRTTKLPMEKMRVFVKNNSNKFYRFSSGTYRPQKLESISHEALIFADKFLFEVPQQILENKKGRTLKEPTKLIWDENTPVSVKQGVYRQGYKGIYHLNDTKKCQEPCSPTSPEMKRTKFRTTYLNSLYDICKNRKYKNINNSYI